VGGISVSALLYIFKGYLFEIEDPFLYVSWWSFLAGLIIAIVVSLFTRPHPDERLYGLVYRLPDPKPNTAQVGV
jgi:SSS family solute:Na+ symporter